MKFFTLITLVSAVSAAPFSLPNGFPKTPNSQDLLSIEKQAGGTLPNTPLPSQLDAGDVQALQIIAANEIFEVAYFSSLLDNVTNNVDGYTNFGGQSRDYVVESLKAIRAQEELHALGANGILAAAGAQTIGACNYKFPVSNFADAVDLADTFTSLVLGTLAGVQGAFAQAGGQGVGLIPLVGSIIGQEAQQDGAYRLLGKKVPSAAPFLTGASGVFAFNAVNQLFIVNGSCEASSNVSAINVPQLAPLQLQNPMETIQPKNQTLTFVTPYSGDASHVAYISGQNAPVVRSISNKKSGSGGMNTFQAHFPFGAGFAKGLTIAALVNSEGPFDSPTAVANATVAGPGLIKVD